LNQENEKVNKTEEKDLAYLLGIEAFKEILRASNQDKDPSTKRTLLDDPEIVFEYLYLEIPTNHPTKVGEGVGFLKGWEEEEEKYQLQIDAEIEEAYRSKELYPREGIFTFDNDSGKKDEKAYDYSKYRYVEPKLIYDRFNKVETSTKKIVFPKDLSELFWNIFQTASGKEIMFYGEMIQSEEDKDLYTVSGMNFPPQKNYGGYVETVDGKYETWVFNEIILKGKKIPLHVHTHPDFSAFSSSVDERQIKQYIEDNEGNPFVVQLIVSNPRKGSYFIRWFDLENDTWERPNVEFTFDKYDVEAEFPGIFQFDAPPRVTSSPSSRLSDFNYKSWYSDFKGRGFYEDDEDEDHEEAKDLYHDEDGEDLSDPKEFDKYFSKNYKKLIKN
jgi:hypothetical protein